MSSGKLFRSRVAETTLLWTRAVNYLQFLEIGTLHGDFPLVALELFFYQKYYSTAVEA